MAQKSHFSASLNAARFAVGLSVMLVHFLPLPLVDLGAPAILLQFLNTRNLTSSFFFVLSGFIVVITATKGGAPNVIGREAPRAFVLKRLSRLWPAHVVGFAVMAPTAFIGLHKVSMAKFAAEAAAWLTMMHGFLPALAVQYNGPAWAVTSFALGYAASPVFIRWERWSLSRMAAVAAALWLTSLCVQASLIFGQSGTWDSQIVQRHANSAAVERLQLILHTSPLFRVPEMACGALAALMVRRRESQVRSQWISGETVLLLITPLTVASMFWIGSLDDRYLFLFTHGALTPAIMVVLAALWHSNGWLERLCARSWLRRGGQSGILIYFLHRPVFSVLDLCLRQTCGTGGRENARSMGLALTASAFTVALAFLVQPAYDRMCRRLANRLLEPKAATVLSLAEVSPCAR